MLNLNVRPMAVLSSFRPLEEVEASRLAFIERYDFGKIRTRVLKDGNVSLEEVDEAIAEFRKFMSLVALGHRSIAMMNPAVDEIWHTMIIHTKDYAEFCDEGVGRFVHHQPASEAEPVGQGAKDTFLTAYLDVFGALAPIWQFRLDSDCDSDCKGTNCDTDCSQCRSIPDCATTNCQDDD